MKTALITGTSKGIGLETALAFARAGYKVFATMRNPEMACDFKNKISAESLDISISNSPLGAYAASKHALEAISEALAQEMKPFNVRVAIVEPGIINTDMANDISVDENSIYSHSKRLAGLFAVVLKTPTSPTLVAHTILEIAENNSWKLRYPVGPDAAPFIQWRASLSDEQWTDWNAANDDDWYNAVEQTFGLNAR